MAFLSAYPYLWSSLFLLALWAIGWVALPHARRPIVWSSVLSAPYALASVFFVPEYWQPVRIAVFLTGVEDVIFSFSTGGIAWVLATRVRGLAFQPSPQPPSPAVSRYVLTSGLGLSIGAAATAAGLGTMGSACTSIAAVGTLLIVLRRELWPLCVTGAAGFGVLHTVVLNGAFLLWPEFVAQWSLDGLSGRTLLLIPAEEVAWAVGYGAVWPLFVAHTLGLCAQAGGHPGLVVGKP